MNILIDTNIIIPLEPGSFADLEINTELALQFHSLVQKSENVAYVHPAIEYDFNRDKNVERANLRKTLVKRYNIIDSPPPVTILDTTHVGTPEFGSNDYVDNCFLASLKGDAVDYLVTEDKGIHRKAKKPDLHSRVLYLRDAIALLKGVETVQNLTEFIISLLNFSQFFKFFWLKSFAILPDFVFSLLKSHIRAALL